MSSSFTPPFVGAERRQEALRVYGQVLLPPESVSQWMAMSPDNTLSTHKEVVLLARISASGNPIAQPGDMEGWLVGVAVGR